MLRRSDPRITRTINTISQNVETATETAQAGIYTFSSNYVGPCFSSIGQCFHSCTEPCFPSREEQMRRRRGRTRGRAELNFDFYDDWDDDDAGDGFMNWGNDELEGLLAGSGSRGASADQPRRQNNMNYGTRRRGKSTLGDEDDDEGGPEMYLPRTSVFGFLERLPFRIGGRGLRYKPSAAGLQEHPGEPHRGGADHEPLLEESDEDGRQPRKKHRRDRSDTVNSRSTMNSLSSRGDLLPSDEEDDAVPLDDEFAMALGRRNTMQGSDDRSSGKTGSGKRPTPSRNSTRTASSNHTKRTRRSDQSDKPSSIADPDMAEANEPETPSLAELKRQEEDVRRQEEIEIESKREAAYQLAAARALNMNFDSSSVSERNSHRASNLTNARQASEPPTKDRVSESVEEVPATSPEPYSGHGHEDDTHPPPPDSNTSEGTTSTEFIPARLPNFSNENENE